MNPLLSRRRPLNYEETSILFRMGEMAELKIRDEKNNTRMSVKSRLAHGLQKCVEGIYHSENLTDFTVEVEGATFKCHKFILNACSDFFKALFRSHMKKCQENRATIHGMTKETFALIHRIVYTGEDCVTLDNVLDVWAGTVQLQIGYLIEECEIFLKTKLSIDNCFDIYIYAKRYSSEKLIDAVLKFVQEHFELIRRDERFLELNAHEVYTVVTSDDLKKESEDSLVECILKWMEYVPHEQETSHDTQAEERRTATIKLLSAVRISRVSDVCLRKLLNLRFIQCFRQAFEMVSGELVYKISDTNRHYSWAKPVSTYLRSDHLMVFVKGNKLMAYSLNTDSFYERKELSRLPLSRHTSITVFDNVILVDNGITINTLTRESWEYPLLKTTGRYPPQRNLLLSLGDYIYCYDVRLTALKYVNCDETDGREWKICKVDVVAHSMVRFRWFILMLSTERDTVNVKCYNTCTGQFVLCIPKTSLAGPTDNLISFTDQNDVYILQKNGHLWKITSTDSSPVDFIFIAALWDFDWEIFGAVVYHRQLFIFVNGDNTLPDNWPAPHLQAFNTVNIIRINSDSQCVPMVKFFL